MDAKFQALAAASIGDNTPMNAIFNDEDKTDIAGLFSANSNGTWSIVKVNGKNCLQLVSGSWTDGLGIKDDAVFFAVGDRILLDVTITAYTLNGGAGNSGLVGKKINGWTPLAFEKVVDAPATLAAGNHKLKCTINAEQAAGYSGGSGINVGINNGNTYTITFNEIIIYGPDKPAPAAWNWSDSDYNDW
jgi:hypothetical protein